MYSLLIMTILIFLPLPIMASTARKTGNGYKAVFEGVFSVGVAMMMMFMIAASTGNPIGKAMLTGLQSFCEAAAQTDQIVSMLGLQDVSMSERISTLTKVYSYAINSLPAITMMCATVLAYLEYRIISRMSQKMKNPLPMLAPISEFSMPRRAVWGWIFIYLMSMGVALAGFSAGDVLLINSQLLFQFVFQIQGVAVMFYFCKMKKLNNIVPIILCLIVAASAMGQMLLCLLGFMDLGFGLRRMMKKR